jgi:CDP-L-myo-inositol myo-inositolphosphotransferase
MEPTRERICVLLALRRRGAERTSLFGLTPVERTVLAFLRAGVRRFLVVGDPQTASETERILRRGACRAGRFRCVDSLRTALGGDELFYLVRTDCQYERCLITRFVQETGQVCDSVVAVDFREEARAAHEELPRVSVWNGAPWERARMVGKNLVGSNGVLIGLALATPAWGRALGSLRDGEKAWLEALATLVQREPVETWPVRELWHEVRESADLSVARRQVLAAGVRLGDGPIARYLNRPISQRITARLLSRDVKPWQVTLASFASTLAAAASFAVGHAATGGFLAQMAAVLDGVDGELARVRYQDSPFSGLYDALLDRVGGAALIGGMTLYAWLMGAGNAVVAWGFAAVAGSSLSMLVKEKYGTQFKRPFGEEQDGRLRWLLVGRDGRLFLTLVAGVTGQVEAVLAYLAVGTHVHAGARIVRIRAQATRA